PASSAAMGASGRTRMMSVVPCNASRRLTHWERWRDSPRPAASRSDSIGWPAPIAPATDVSGGDAAIEAPAAGAALHRTRSFAFFSTPCMGVNAADADICALAPVAPADGGCMCDISFKRQLLSLPLTFSRLLLTSLLQIVLARKFFLVAVNCARSD